MTKITVNGKSYISISDIDAAGFRRSCLECGFDATESCKLVYAFNDECYGIIWKEDVLAVPDDEQSSVQCESDEDIEKYTIDEFFHAYAAWVESGKGRDMRDFMKSHFTKIKDPQYSVYLELKKKFGE